MTDTSPTDEAILKTDVLGRVKTPMTRREQLLDEFEQSGLSGQKFAELTGIKYQTFATWVQRRRRARGATGRGPAKVSGPSAPSVRWLEAVVEQAQRSDAGIRPVVVLELPGPARVEIANARQAELAAALLGALQSQRPPC